MRLYALKYQIESEHEFRITALEITNRNVPTLADSYVDQSENNSYNDKTHFRHLNYHHFVHKFILLFFTLNHSSFKQIFYYPEDKYATAVLQRAYKRRCACF